MAHLHFRRTVYKSGGRKAASRVAYIARQQPLDRDAEHQLRYIQRADVDMGYTRNRHMILQCGDRLQLGYQHARQSVA